MRVRDLIQKEKDREAEAQAARIREEEEERINKQAILDYFRRKRAALAERDAAA